MHTANKPRPTDAVDWLALFPAEQAPGPGQLEGPAVQDPFELFACERRLVEPPPVLPLLAAPRAVPIRHLQAVPRPAIRIVVEPVAPVWRVPEIELSAPARTMILTGVAVMLLTVFVRTQLPPMPQVARTSALEPARSIDVPTLAPSLALAAPKGVVPAPPAAAGKSLPTAPAKASLAARLPTPPVPRTDTRPRSADATAPRSVAATAAITPPASATATSGADVNTPSLLTQEPARVADVAPATVVPAALTPPPTAPPARLVDSTTVRVTDTAAIESVLGRYRNAYTALSMHDVQRVWPQVDRRALERTFSEVDEQALQFDDCRIDITGRDARAACSGSARSLPKGSSRPKLESRRWDFTLSKIGTDWLILSAQSRR